MSEQQQTRSRRRWLLGGVVLVALVVVSLIAYWNDAGNGNGNEASQAAKPTLTAVDEPGPTMVPTDTPADDELDEAQAAWDVEDELEEARLAREAHNLVKPIEVSVREYGAPAELAIRELVELSCEQTTANPYFWERADDLYDYLRNEKGAVSQIFWPPTLAEAWSLDCDS